MCKEHFSTFLHFSSWQADAWSRSFAHCNSRPICWEKELSFCSFFFFPPAWPIRTRLGPYNCVSSEKQKCTRTRVVQKLRQIITKNKENQNSTTTATKNDPQIPQPDLRFATSKTAKQQKTGQGPTKPQNTFRFALDTVTLATVSSSKTCKLITNAAVHGI